MLPQNLPWDLSVRHVAGFAAGLAPGLAARGIIAVLVASVAVGIAAGLSVRLPVDLAVVCRGFRVACRDVPRGGYLGAGRGPCHGSSTAYRGMLWHVVVCCGMQHVTAVPTNVSAVL